MKIRPRKKPLSSPLTAKQYRQAVKITGAGYEFESLIMAALLNSDENNYMILSAMYPAICEEVKARYFHSQEVKNAGTVAGSGVSGKS